MTKIEKHPNADRLRLIEVFDGHRSIFPVVCGAFNFEVGDTVALALPGARIPKNIHSDTHEGFRMDKATIRGVESQGMLCAAFELDLSDDLGQGIMILKDEVKLGDNFKRSMIK